MSVAEAEFGGTSSRISVVKAEVFCECESKHRAVNMSAEKRRPGVLRKDVCAGI